MSGPADTVVATDRQRWLLLVHQLPAKPAYLRVKIWRRLQGVGAVAVKNAVYALPANEETQEDFEWCLREISEAGGEAMICEARLIGGLSDQHIRALFDRARDENYEQISKDAAAIFQFLGEENERSGEKRHQIIRLRKRLAEVNAIDFFGANGREAAEGMVSALEERLKEEAAAPQVEIEAAPAAIGRGRTWVTRKGVHVDRIASAWLIRRFIDPEMRLKFVPPDGYVPDPRELRFDMFEAEFTHIGDSCTFEVLLARAALDDPALRRIAEIVHDIDIKDAKFAHEETSGIKALINGTCMTTADDNERISRGAALFDDLYEYFRAERGEARERRE